MVQHCCFWHCSFSSQSSCSPSFLIVFFLFALGFSMFLLVSEPPTPKGAEKFVPRENCQQLFLTLFDGFLPCEKLSTFVSPPSAGPFCGMFFLFSSCFSLFSAGGGGFLGCKKNRGLGHFGWFPFHTIAVAAMNGPTWGFNLCRSFKAQHDEGQQDRNSDRGLWTTHHPHKSPSSSGGTFGGGVCEMSEPKKKAKYAPPPVLHSWCWSSILWGWCVDFAVWSERKWHSDRGSARAPGFCCPLSFSKVTSWPVVFSVRGCLWATKTGIANPLLDKKLETVGCCFAPPSEGQEIPAFLSGMTCLKLTKLDKSWLRWSKTGINWLKQTKAD